MVQTNVLDDVAINRIAPSVFAREAWQETSGSYRFLPTISIVNALRDSGFNVVKVAQSRCRIEGKGDFTKHMLRLRHNSQLQVENIGDEVPEIVLVDSHDRSASFQLMLGIFRLVCSNGMVVASSTIDSLFVRHSGSNNLLNNVIDVTAKIINEAPRAFEQINRFKSIPLTPDEQIAFAVGARELSESTIDIKPASLLTSRRWPDRPNTDGSRDVWKTANVIQENLIRGGILGVSPSNRLLRTRPVRSVQGDVGINRAIWKLMEHISKLKTKDN